MANGTILPDPGAFLYMREVPDLRPVADVNVVIYVADDVYEIIACH